MLWAGHVVADHLAVDVVRLGEDQRGQQLESHQGSRGGGAQQDVPAGPVGQQTQRVAHAQEAVHRDAGQQQEAAVEVGVEQEAHQLAEQLPEGPSVPQGAGDDEEGQCQHIKQVGYHQVHQIDGGTAPALGLVPGESQNSAIQGEA